MFFGGFVGCAIAQQVAGGSLHQAGCQINDVTDHGVLAASHVTDYAAKGTASSNTNGAFQTLCLEIGPDGQGSTQSPHSIVFVR